MFKIPQNSIILASFLLSHCGPKAETSHSLADESLTATRLALREFVEQSPTISWENLVAAGDLSEPTIDIMAQTDTNRIPKVILDSFTAGFKFQTYTHKDKVLRYETLTLNSALKEPAVKLGDEVKTLPFRLSGQATIEMVRPFEDHLTAAKARPLDLLDIPTTAEDLRDLEDGTYIAFPIDTNLMFDVNGNLMQKSADLAPALGKFVTMSAQGLLSGVMQGSIIANGSWQMQIAKLPGNHVRLRVNRITEFNTEANVNLQGMYNYSYRFLGAGIVDKALSIHQDVLQKLNLPASKLLNKLQSVQAEITSRRQTANKHFSYVEKAAEILPKLIPEKNLADFSDKVDEAVTLATKAESSLDSLAERLRNLNDRMIAKLNDPLTNHIIEPLNGIRKHLDRTFNFNQSVSLDGKFAKDYKVVADYQFDLNDPDARQALDMAISGRALFLANKPLLGSDSDQLADLTVAERIAKEDQTKAKRRVIRLLLGEHEAKTSKLAVSFNGIFTAANFSSATSAAKATLTQADGRSESWEAIRWDLGNSHTALGNMNAEAISSGFYYPTTKSFQPISPGSYWMAWRLSQSQGQIYQQGYRYAVNILGPLAYQLNIPSHFYDEYDGATDFNLRVGFDKQLFDLVFAQEKVPLEAHWQAFRNLLKGSHYESGDGIKPPMGDLPFELPAKYQAIKAAKEACVTDEQQTSLAKQKSYLGICQHFVNDFLQGLADIHAMPAGTEKYQAQMKILEKLTRSRKGANYFGAILATRYLIEFVYALAPKKIADLVSVNFSVANSKHDHNLATTEINWGEPTAEPVFDTITQMP